MRYLFFFLLLFFGGCSTKSFSHKESKIVVIKSPKIRFSDIGYIKHDGDAIELELYSTGVAIETISIDRLVCVKKGCMSKKAFNEQYLSKAYPDDTMANILMRKPIFGGKNMQKQSNGFVQRIKTDVVNITYKVSDGNVYFKDRRNAILFKLKNIRD